MIHPTAIISTGAVIGEGVSIGAYSFIGPNVRIGNGTRIASHVVIDGHTNLGAQNIIFQFASVGSQPQDLKYKGEPSQLIVGDNNLIREYVTLQPGTEGGGMITRIGNRNLFMVSSHVGHDSVIGDDNVVANCAAIAGHVHVGNKVIIGGLSAIHQFCRVGDFSMIAGGAAVTQDVSPFTIVQGDRARTCGVNTIGMERAQYSKEEIAAVRKVYKIAFSKSPIPLRERIENAKSQFQSSPAAMKVLNFFSTSERGVATTRRTGSDT